MTDQEAESFGPKLARLMGEWVEAYWGERCPEQEPGCPCCRAWDAYDYLFQQSLEEKS